ncbi:MAG: flagellar basal body rod protein FlgC [Bacteroidota bacterium]
MLSTDRFFSVFKTSARGLEAQRIALGTASENLANARTSRTADGTPYAIKRAVHELPEVQRDQFGNLLDSMQLPPVRTSAAHMARSPSFEAMAGQDLGPQTNIEEQVQLRAEYDPNHPHADANGYVQYPDVNVVEEMARMISANRIYEANLTAVQAAKEMIKRTLEI